MSNLKKLFKNLQRDLKYVLFAKEKIDDKVLKKLKKSLYKKDNEFVNLFNSNVNVLDDEKKTITIKITFVEKNDDVDRSTLYNFDGPLQLLHADVENLEFLGKSAADPKCFLLFVKLLTSKVCVCPMKSRKSIASKIEIFYKEVEPKRKG